MENGSYEQEFENGLRTSDLDVMKKRRIIYVIVYFVALIIYFIIATVVSLIDADLTTLSLILSWIIAIINIITASSALYCQNNIRYVASGGTKQGGGLLWVIFLIMGFIIFPIIFVVIVRRIPALTKLVLGIKR